MQPNNEKTCGDCKETKLLTTEFFRLKRRKHNNTIKEHWDSDCIQCSNKYANAWMNRRNNLLKTNDPEKFKQFKERSKANNRRSQNNQIRNLSNWYIGFVLGIKTKDLKKYSPKFIKTKKMQIELHRFLYPNHRNIK